MVFLCGAILLFTGCRPPVEPCLQSSLPGETVFFVPNVKKMVALTFDDGPNGSATEKILNSLHERNVPATFFVIGANAERYPHIVKRITAEGHLIGIHTYSHPRFDQISATEREQDIIKARAAIEKITGLRPVWYRPPYGINGTNLTDICRKQGLVVAGWSLDANDWNRHPVEDLVEAIVNQVTPGDIILLHDGWETRPDADRNFTAAAVPVIIDKLRQAGFTFVTLSELQRNAGMPIAVFENGIRLLGMQIAGKPVCPGGFFDVRYFWDVPENFKGKTPSVFVHFTRSGSKYFFQDDHDLCPRGDVRDLVVHSRIVSVPQNAPPGKYEIKTGLFLPEKPEAKDRLKVRTGFPQSQRAVFLPSGLEVVPAPAKIK